LSRLIPCAGAGLEYNELAMVLINGYCFCPELVVRFAEATCTQFAPNQVEQTTQRDRADPGSSMHFIKSE